jgi:hypothetical protein
MSQRKTRAPILDLEHFRERADTAMDSSRRLIRECREQRERAIKLVCQWQAKQAATLPFIPACSQDR